ncbi:MAG: hypothetical protein WB729_25045 [Candidatus Sulfotelmatobacter sp.]
MAEEMMHYDAVISDLEGKRDRLSGIIEALRQLRELGVPLAAASAVTGGIAGASIDTNAPIPHDAFFGMTVPEAARKYLSWGGRKVTKPHPELCDAMLEGGFQTKADNFREVVRSTLGRHPDFVKIKGQWGLREWYPGYTGGRKPKRASTEEPNMPELDPTGEGGPQA